MIASNSFFSTAFIWSGCRIAKPSSARTAFAPASNASTIAKKNLLAASLIALLRVDVDDCPVSLRALQSLGETMRFALEAEQGPRWRHQERLRRSRLTGRPWSRNT